MYTRSDAVYREDEDVRRDNNLMSREDRHETLLLMQHHDTLLQNHRSQFLTFQTLAFAICVFFVFQNSVSGDPLALIAILLFSIFAGPVFIFAIWMPFANRHIEMVSKAMYLLKSNQMVDFSPFKIIGSRGSKYGMYFDDKELADLERTQTRTNFDKIIPWLFEFFWMVLIFGLYAKIVLLLFAH